MDPIEVSNSFEQYICERATLNCVPINAIFELTPLCNMSCDMCYVRLTPAQAMEQGGVRPAVFWMRLAEQLKEQGTLFVLLTGGEPLLYPDFKKLYTYLKELGMIVTINTNGTLIDDSWVAFFEQDKPRRINITLYGNSEASYQSLCHYPGGYGRTIAAIEKLQKARIDVKVNGSITPSNLRDMKDMAGFLEMLDVPFQFDTYMYPAVKGHDHVFDRESRLSPRDAAEAKIELLKHRHTGEEFEHIVRDFLSKTEDHAEHKSGNRISCRAGRSSFCVNWQGRLRPCVLMVEPEFTLDDQPFASAWASLTQRFASYHLNEGCKDCEYREVCSTCAACAYWEGGACDSVPEYMCEYTRETVRFMKSESEKAGI